MYNTIKQWVTIFTLSSTLLIFQGCESQVETNPASKKQDKDNFKTMSTSSGLSYVQIESELLNAGYVQINKPTWEATKWYGYTNNQYFYNSSTDEYVGIYQWNKPSDPGAEEAGKECCLAWDGGHFGCPDSGTSCSKEITRDENGNIKSVCYVKCEDLIATN